MGRGSGKKGGQREGGEIVGGGEDWVGKDGIEGDGREWERGRKTQKGGGRTKCRFGDSRGNKIWTSGEL